MKQKPNIQIFTEASRSPKRRRRGATGRPHHQGAWPTDAGRMTTQLGTPRGRYDEYGSKFSLSKKLRFIDIVGKS
jgi:hypothetical protein